MKMADGGFRPAYNIQVATDTGAQVVVGVGVTNVGSDRGESTPMVDAVAARADTVPPAWLIDGGFVGRNASDVTTFHHVNGIHDQVRSGPGHPSRSSSGFSPPSERRPPESSATHPSGSILSGVGLLRYRVNLTPGGDRCPESAAAAVRAARRSSAPIPG